MRPTADRWQIPNILLVDDRESNLLALEAVLSAPGQNLIKARSGREALKCILNHEIALVLLDVTMPGMGGFETAALIRAREKTRHLPIIFITGVNVQESQVFKGYSMGGVDYLLKPFAPEVLRGKVGVFVELFKKTAKINRQSQMLERRNRELHSEIRQRKRVEGELLKLNRTLEQRVAERTAAAERHASDLARSNAELEEFAYVASHDLQEPLRKIINFGGILESSLSKVLVGETKEYFSYMVDGAARMKNLIHDLLEYSRVGRKTLAVERVETEDLVKEVIFEIDPMIKESATRITLGGLPPVTANPVLLHQLFQNLILNAVKFRGKDNPSVEISGRQNGSACYFTVRDNGIGVPARQAKRIFKIFQRLHGRDEYPGSGIGLAICKKIVERHGGKIWVDPGPVRGSEFCFTIPNGKKGKISTGPVRET